MEQSTVLPPLEPLSESERITIIDSLRGIALLGILMMNIPFFGYPVIQASNPMIANEMGTINFQVWYVVEGFLEGTQRGFVFYVVWVWRHSIHHPPGKESQWYYAG